MRAAVRWTSEDVARRAAEHLVAQCTRQRARWLYSEACERYKDRCNLERVDVTDPAFRRATKKAYATYRRARQAEYNAARRLATAIRGSEVFLEVSDARAR